MAKIDLLAPFAVVVVFAARLAIFETSTPTPTPTPSPFQGIVHYLDVFVQNEQALPEKYDNYYIITKSVVIRYNPSFGLHNAFPNLVEIGNRLSVIYNEFTSMLTAFPALQNVQKILIAYNNNLQSLGQSFASLERIGADSGESLLIYNNTNLATLGTAFSNLRRVQGVIGFSNNPQLSDFSALDSLECHGGIQYNDAINFCQNCPAKLVNLPICCGEAGEPACQ